MGEKIVNGFLFALSAAYFYLADQYAFGTPTDPKLGFLPHIVAWVALVLTGYLFVQSLLGRGDAKNVKMAADFRRLGLLVLIMAAYIALFKPVGYLISTAALLFCVMKVGKVKGWKVPLAVSVLTSVVFYVIFRVWLQVNLPTGILSF